ncbi:MAG: hypothetical protein LBS25_10630 [Candidatus Symbiothrix sp.]|jgi:hypothetical protein|nr:hypothetical protein [Candidatus Symbiothrix sp.]
MKRIIISAIAILIAIGSFAERRNIRERSETWLQPNNTEENTSGNSLRASITPGNPGSTAQGEDAPIGNALLPVFGLALAYGLSFKKTKR